MKLEIMYKYFIGGVFYSLLMGGYIPFVFLVDWILSYDRRPLTLEPLIVLFVIVYIFLGIFIAIGAVNHAIANHLWATPVGQTWQVLLGNGALLFFVLCLIQIPVAISTALIASVLYGGLFPSIVDALIVTLGLSIAITSIPNGIVCRHLALQNSEPMEE
ncbi:MAG: hypothetical protein ACFFAX_12230 [Promethearchaeota archaeon]